MEYNTLIEAGFKAFVDTSFQNEGIIKFLKKHDRLPKLIENLSKELLEIEPLISTSAVWKTQQEKRDVIKGLIKDFSRVFCNAALSEAKSNKLKKL